VLRKVTTFGAVLLIGTALLVIIPEGVESLFGEGTLSLIQLFQWFPFYYPNVDCVLHAQ